MMKFVCPCCGLSYETPEDFLIIKEYEGCMCGYGKHHNFRFSRQYNQSSARVKT